MCVHVRCHQRSRLQQSVTHERWNVNGMADDAERLLDGSFPHLRTQLLHRAFEHGVDCGQRELCVPLEQLSRGTSCFLVLEVLRSVMSRCGESGRRRRVRWGWWGGWGGEGKMRRDETRDETRPETRPETRDETRETDERDRRERRERERRQPSSHHTLNPPRAKERTHDAKRARTPPAGL